MRYWLMKSEPEVFSISDLQKKKKTGWDGVRDFIDEHILTPGLHQNAMKFANEYRKKWAKDEFSYPIEWLIRQLLLGEFAVTSATPVGPKTRAHTRRLAAQAVLDEQAQMDASTLDAQDDFQ